MQTPGYDFCAYFGNIENLPTVSTPVKRVTSRLLGRIQVIHLSLLPCTRVKRVSQMLMSGTHVKDSATHFSCVQQALLQLVICCKDLHWCGNPSEIWCIHPIAEQSCIMEACRNVVHIVWVRPLVFYVVFSLHDGEYAYLSLFDTWSYGGTHVWSFICNYLHWSRFGKCYNTTCYKLLVILSFTSWTGAYLNAC